MIEGIKAAIDLKLNMRGDEFEHIAELNEKCKSGKSISILGYDYRINSIAESFGGLRSASVELQCLGVSELGRCRHCDDFDITEKQAKPRIKLIDRREQYEQRKLNFIARMNQYVNLYLGLTISNIRDAVEVYRMMKQCTPDDYCLGLSRIKVNQGRGSK